MSSARPSAVFGGAGAPVLAQPDQVDVLLAVAGVERGDLASPEAARAALVHVLDHLRSPGRELVDHLAGDALQVGEPFVRRFPLDPESARELAAEVGLVEVAGGEPVGLEDRLAVERPPLAVAGAAGHVGDDHVGV